MDLAIASGVIQLILLALGAYVSLNPVRRKKDRYRYMLYFIALGSLGIGVNVWEELRDGASSAGLQQAVNRVADQTKQPPSVSVTVPPSPPPVVHLVPPRATQSRVALDPSDLPRFLLGGDTNTLQTAQGWIPVYEWRPVTVDWDDEWKDFLARVEIKYRAVAYSNNPAMVTFRLVSVNESVEVVRSDLIRPLKVDPSDTSTDILRLALPRSRGMKTYRLDVLPGDEATSVAALAELVMYPFRSGR